MDAEGCDQVVRVHDEVNEGVYEGLTGEVQTEGDGYGEQIIEQTPGQKDTRGEARDVPTGVERALTPQEAVPLPCPT